MNIKQDLARKIKDKEHQLSLARKESNALNQGKYRTSSNAKISKVLVKSLCEEIDNLREKFENL